MSSIEIEDLAMQHPDALQAAAIGVPDEKWGERPVFFVALWPQSVDSAEDILALYAGRGAKCGGPAPGHHPRQPAPWRHREGSEEQAG